MRWYSDALLLHGERLCQLATSIFHTSRPRSCSLSYRSSHPASPLDMDSSSRVPAAFAARLATAHQTSNLASQGNTGCNANFFPLPVSHHTDVAVPRHTSISHSSSTASSSTHAVKGHSQELSANENVNLSNHNSVRQRHAPVAPSPADASNQDALAEAGSLQQNGNDVQRQADFQWQTSGASQSAESAKNASVHNTTVDR